jgi:hypothetical protein
MILVSTSGPESGPALVSDAISDILIIALMVLTVGRTVRHESAICYETDTIIQASARTELMEDVTVIAIAHRLQTGLDSDRIVSTPQQCDRLSPEIDVFQGWCLM